MAFPQGIDFRSSSGFVTDPTNCAAELGGGLTYPTTTAQGNQVGWESGYVAGNEVDRDNTIDARLAGSHFTSPAAATYRIDLPATGSYVINLALGDAISSGLIEKLELFDTTTSLGVLVNGSNGSSFTTWGGLDAQNNLYTSSAAWAAANPLGGGGTGSITKTFSTTIARFTVGDGTNFATINHIFIKAAGAAAASPFFGLALYDPRRQAVVTENRGFLNPAEIQLIGKDKFFGAAGEPPRNYDWPNPVLRRDDVNRRGWFVNLLLSTLYTVIVPFAQRDWPNPWGRLFPSSLRTHTDPVKLELAGQDQFFGLPGQPPANQDQPNPTRAKSPAVDLKTWLGNLLQSTLGFVIAPFAQRDHPNPRGYVFPTSLRTHTDQLRFLAGKDTFFAGPGRGPAYDWPNPRGYVPGISLRTHTDPLKLELRGQDRMFGAAGEPPKPSDFPVPKGYVYPSGLRTFIATLSAAASAFRAPSTRLLNPVPSLVPADTLNVANWLVRASRAINGMLRGNIGATLHITLAAGATSSVIYDARINANSHIGLSAQTASAATALASGSLYIVPATGQATIFHPNTADLDKTFAAVVLR